MNWPKIVAIGGGTGLSTLLRGLKNYPVHLSAIVTMTDNGASSGRLSKQTGILPAGDVRQCLAALAQDESLLAEIFQYRFKNGHGITGHSLGNLLILALTDITGSFDKAIEASSRILNIKGQVIPSTLDCANLVGYLKNGQMVLGECELPIQGHRFGIDHVEIIPQNAKANKNAVTYLENADVILVGPGSFYTSLIPNFLIKGIRNAFEKSPATKIYLANCSTERGETENFTVADHIEQLAKYVDVKAFSAIIANSKGVKQAEEGKLGGIYNATTSEKEIMGIPVISADVIDDKRPLYHDHKKLSREIWEYIAQTD